MVRRDIHPNETDNWLAEQLDKATSFESEATEDEFIGSVLDRVLSDRGHGHTKRLMLAAVYDLVVAAAYYRTVAHGGWLYCPAYNEDRSAFMLYPYTNTCPRCALDNRFEFHQASV
jgi:hypothetical protein